TSGSGEGKGVIVDRTKMIMEEVRISNVAMGVEVTGGILAMKGGEIGFTGDYGISLKEGGAAFLGKVTIKGNGTGQEGIKLNGGMIDLYKTNIREVHKGMTITEGIVRMFGGEIGFKGEHGISLTKSTAALIGVTIEGNGIGQEGIKLSEGMVDLFGTNIREVQRGKFKGDYAVYLGKGIAALKDVRITGPSNKGTGVYVQSGVGAVMMKEVRISEVRTGVEVISGKLIMHKGSVEFKGEYGISLIRGDAALKDVNITGQGHETEVAVKTIMGTVAIKGGEMSNVGTGVEVKSEGAVWLVDTKLRDVYKGVSAEDGVVHM
ncbi:hypothetical protein, partial [Bartonella bovis]|uniref:hypothetical protein n=1 Tax=Bartonella bovis TaxID=155194 RepID=UPI001304F1D1